MISDASEDDLGMTFHGYQRVDSDPTLSDNHRTALINGNDDYASTYRVGLDFDDSSFDELERQELEDHLGEIPETFHRRQRRVSLCSMTILALNHFLYQKF
ncbi:unnamed protein product [Nippostrongylus brasiliensis]|uniref:DUF2052 domain-containing protein n=1 Tax=Nippostrongylus brasiliensis TaxID=27835 RepID=A0A0N4XKP9_NIPBR|nr:unnamed protein product [Nippostrongylus brasiliensis]